MANRFRAACREMLKASPITVQLIPLSWAAMAANLISSATAFCRAARFRNWAISSEISGLPRHHWKAATWLRALLSALIMTILVVSFGDVNKGCQWRDCRLWWRVLIVLRRTDQVRKPLAASATKIRENCIAFLAKTQINITILQLSPMWLAWGGVTLPTLAVVVLLELKIVSKELRAMGHTLKCV